MTLLPDCATGVVFVNENEIESSLSSSPEESRVHSGVDVPKKVGGQLQIQTDDIMGAYNFDFVSKFLHSGGFQLKFCTEFLKTFPAPAAAGALVAVAVTRFIRSTKLLYAGPG